MMKKRPLLISLTIIGIVLLIVVYQITQSVPVDGMKVLQGTIQEYIDETGTVKSQQSQTVYLNNNGKITSLLVDQGDQVRLGQILLKISPADLKIAKITSEQARINLESAKKAWENAQKFFRDGAISKDDFDNARDTFKRALNALESSDLELGKDQENLIVQAPLEGIVLQKSVDINEVVTPGTAAFIIGSLKNLEIDVDILADDVVKIQPGNPVEITGQSTGGSVLHGKVRKVAPMAQNVVSSLGVNQKRATVTIDFMNGTGSLKPGYDVDVRIFTRTKTHAVIVPATAVFDLQGNNYVFTVMKGRTELRKIQKGLENDDQIEIQSGIKPGEWILTKPDNSIKAGLKVKITEV